MGDYASQKKLESGFAHFVDPQSTTLSVLGSIKHLMSIHDEGSDEYKALQQIAKAESANVTAGAIALQSSPLLQEKLGTGFQAAQAVSELLQRRRAESLYNAAIDKTLAIDSIKAKGFGKRAEELIAQDGLITFART